MLKDYYCFYCFANTFCKLIENSNLTLHEKTDFTNYFAQLAENKHKYSSVEFAVELHRKFKQLSGIEDVFAKEKKLSNKKATELVLKLLPKITKTENKFDFLLRLAIAGNIMDYGAPIDRDIEKTIEYVLNSDFAIDHSKKLQKEIKSAKQILYLGDNAGEIVFDKLFINEIKHKNLYYSVRGFPIINDVTEKDANELELNKVAKIISNGYDAPSTIIEKCSSEFLEIWNNSDLIISKGQGNLEGLLNVKDKSIYFLLMVKCDVIARHLRVKKGDFVVCNN